MIEEYKVIYFANKVKKLNKLIELEMDLSKNEINDNNYVELIEKISNLESLSNLKLSL